MLKLHQESNSQVRWERSRMWGHLCGNLARPKFSKWDFVVERGGDDWGKERGMEWEREREREKLAFATLSLLSFAWVSDSVSEWVKHFSSFCEFPLYFVTLTLNFMRVPYIGSLLDDYSPTSKVSVHGLFSFSPFWLMNDFWRQFHPKGRCNEGHSKYRCVAHRIFFALALLPFQYAKIVVCKRVLKSRMNKSFSFVYKLQCRLISSYFDWKLSIFYRLFSLPQSAYPLF